MTTGPFFLNLNFEARKIKSNKGKFDEGFLSPANLSSMRQ
jgi:hypothetical protein